MTRTTQVGKLEDAYLQGKLFYIISGAKHMMPRKSVSLVHFSVDYKSSPPRFCIRSPKPSSPNTFMRGFKSSETFHVLGT